VDDASDVDDESDLLDADNESDKESLDSLSSDEASEEVVDASEFASDDFDFLHHPLLVFFVSLSRCLNANPM